MIETVIQQTINNFLTSTAGVKPELLQDPNTKVSALGIDSLSVIELLFEVEEKHGVEIEDPTILANMTLDDVYKLVESLVAQKLSDSTLRVESAKIEAERKKSDAKSKKQKKNSELAEAKPKKPSRVAAAKAEPAKRQRTAKHGEPVNRSIKRVAAKAKTRSSGSVAARG